MTPSSSIIVIRLPSAFKLLQGMNHWSCCEMDGSVTCIIDTNEIRRSSTLRRHPNPDSDFGSITKYPWWPKGQTWVPCIFSISPLSHTINRIDNGQLVLRIPIKNRQLCLTPSLSVLILSWGLCCGDGRGDSTSWLSLLVIRVQNGSAWETRHAQTPPPLTRVSCGFIIITFSRRRRWIGNTCLFQLGDNWESIPHSTRTL